MSLRMGLKFLKLEILFYLFTATLLNGTSTNTVELDEDDFVETWPDDKQTALMMGDESTFPKHLSTPGFRGILKFHSIPFDKYDGETSNCVMKAEGFVLDKQISAVSSSCSKGCVRKGTCSDCPECEERFTQKIGMFMCQRNSSIFPIQSPLPYCSILETNYMDCEYYEEGERTFLWLLSNGKMLFLDEYSIHEKESFEISDADCGSSCKGCREGKCNGDVKFCSVYGCKKSSKCFCKVQRPYYFIISGGVTYQPECFGLMSLPYRREKKVVKRSYSEGSGSVYCRDGKVTIHTLTDGISYYKICVSPDCSLVPFSNPTQTFSLSTEQLVSNGDVSVEALSGKDGQRLFLASDKCHDPCPIPKCYLCREFFFNFHCNSSGIKAFAYINILIITSIVTMCLCALVNFIKIVLLLITPLRMLAKILIYPIKALLYSKKPNVANSFEYQEMKPKKSKYGYKYSRGVNIAIIALVLIISSASACSDSSSFNLKTNDCLFDGFHTTCKLNTKVLLSVSPIGQDSCFSVNGPHGEPIGNLVISTKDIKTVCKKSILYYTFDPVVKSPSAHYCAGSSACTKSDSCKPESDKEMPEFESVNGNLGWTGCKPTPGCAANGCFICASGCVYYRAALTNPSGESFQVFNCPSWSYSVTLTLNFLTLTGTKTTTVDLIPGEKVDFQNFRLSLTSISTPPAPITINCFIQDGDRVAHIACNDRLEYSTGRLGEIQCNTEEQAKVASKACFAMPSIVSLEEKYGVVHSSISTVSIPEVFKQNSLPTNRDGMSLLMSDGVVQMIQTSNSLLSLQIEANQVTVSSKVSTNKCVAEFMEITGCYSCTAGATLKIKAKTDFGSTSGVVSCEGLDLKYPISVTDKEDVIEKIVFLTTPDLDTSCVLRCNGKDSAFKLTGKLIYVENTIGVKRSSDERPLFIPQTISFNFKLLDWKLVFVAVSTSCFVLTFIAVFKRVASKPLKEH